MKTSWIFFLCLALFACGRVPQDQDAFSPPIPRSYNVIGGSESSESFSVAAFTASGGLCTAVLVSRNVALTLKHCLPLKTIAVVADTNDDFDCDTSGKCIDVEEDKPAEYSNRKKTGDGVAAVRLNEAQARKVLGDKASFPSLAEPNSRPTAGESLSVTGYGNRYFDKERIRWYGSGTQVTGTMKLSAYYAFSDNSRHLSFGEDDKIACSGDSGAPITSGGKLVGLHQYGNCRDYASAAAISDVHYFVQGRLNAWEEKVTPLKVKVTFADPIKLVKVEDDSGKVKCELKSTGECSGAVPISKTKETVRLTYFYDENGEEPIKATQFTEARLTMKWPRTEAEEADKLFDPRSAEGLGYVGGVSEVPLDGRDVILELSATARPPAPMAGLSIKNSVSSTVPSEFEVFVDDKLVKTTRSLSQGQEETIPLRQGTENVRVRAKTPSKYLKLEECTPGRPEGEECLISSSGVDISFRATFQIGHMAMTMLNVEGSSYESVSISGSQTQVRFNFWADYVESCQVFATDASVGDESLGGATGQGATFGAHGDGILYFPEISPSASLFVTKMLNLRCLDLEGRTIDRAITITKTYSPPTAQISGPSYLILPASGSVVVSYHNSFDCFIQTKLQSEEDSKFSDLRSIPNEVSGSVTITLEGETKSKAYRVKCQGGEVARFMVTFSLPTMNYVSVDSMTGILSFTYQNLVSAYFVSPSGTQTPISLSMPYTGYATVQLSEEGSYQVVGVGADEQMFHSMVSYWPYRPVP